METAIMENKLPPAAERVTQLETRIAYLEDTVETLNHELAAVSAEFRLAKEALQHMYRRMEQIQSGDSGIGNPADEPPPPHY